MRTQTWRTGMPVGRSYYAYGSLLQRGVLWCVALATLVVTPAMAGSLGEPAPTYAVDFVSTAATGLAMNDAGDVAGTSRPDPGCGSQCLPPLETVVWKGGSRIVLPEVPGLTPTFITGINNQGWVTGFAGFPGTITHAVVWKPNGDTYEVIDLGNLPGKTISTAAGIDDLGRVAGWSTTQFFPPSGAPFMWTEAGGMVDLSAEGFPGEWPLGISPGGTVATIGYWYHLEDPGSVTAVTPVPRGYRLENSKVAINDAGDQARFLVTASGQILDYPFRYHHEGTWQQVSFTPTGHLSRYGVGSINDRQDLTVTVLSTGQVAYGPDELAQPLDGLLSTAYDGVVTDGGPLNASGEILAQVLIGRSPRLVRLVPAAPCTSNCTRVTNVEMRAKGPEFCNQGQVHAQARVTVTDETGRALSGVQVGGRFLDDYWLDQPVVGRTNAQGRIIFRHDGPPCVGAIAFLVTDASKPGRAFDRTTGMLTNYVIP